MPGFSGFVAELQVLIGAWHAFPLFAVLAGIGIVVGVAFTLRTLQQSFFGQDESKGALPEHSLPPITLPEKIGSLILISMTVLIGLYPSLLMDLIQPSFQSSLFEALRKGTGQ
jgi:NADH-quinone oxidoreductase subunit M